MSKFQNIFQKIINGLGTYVTGLPWFDMVNSIWKMTRKLFQHVSHEGMYEVLDYESTLELKDRRGKQALFTKREKIRYLQNNILAYQDFAWGDGQILEDYKCTPGVVVDRYRPGQTTYILISLREMKKRGDIDDFNIRWGIGNGFSRSAELWETQFKNRVNRFKVKIIFPKSRPPHRVWLVEANRRKSRPLNPSDKTQLPDGRWLITWENSNPRRYERYLIKWDW